MRRLPEIHARRFRAVVLEDRDGVLLVGMTDPTDLSTIDEVKRFLKRDIDLAVVMSKMRATVRDVSEALGLESLTACNNRMTKLHQLHLVRRTADVVPEGGRLWEYSAIV